MRNRPRTVTTGAERSPLAAALGWVAAALAALVLAPSSVVIGRWKERGRARRGAGEGPPPEEESGADDDAADRLAAALARAGSADEAIEDFLAALEVSPGADVTALALVDEEGRRAWGIAGRGIDEAWWRSIAIDIDHDPGGLATAARERSAFAVYDAQSAPNVSRLAAAVGAKSVAFVPLLAGGRVVGVVGLATMHDRRFFSTAELDLVQRLADAAAPVIDRLRSADAMRRVLDRQKIVSEIGRRLRSKLDVDEVLDVAVRETAVALGAARAFVRFGGDGETARMAAAWTAPGLRPLELDARDLPVANLASKELRTVAVSDVATAPELDDAAGGGRDLLRALGTEAVLATPLVVFDRPLGVLVLHRTEAGGWTEGDVAVAESVAGEAALAIHAARLLSEDERRLGLQESLLKAAQVVTSDLRFESVLRRLVHEVARLFEADAADCWMFEPGKELLRCRAVYGLPEEDEVGRRIPALGFQAEAVNTGKPILRRDFAQTAQPPPTRNFARFDEVMVAPMTWLGEVRGILGVYSREPGRFDSSELEVLDAFARFASLASHNAESFEERERQAQIQQGFYRIAEVLGSPLSLAETLDALAQAAAEALGGDSAVVLEPDGDGLRLTGSHEVSPALADRFAAGLPAEATPFLHAAREERIVSAVALEDDDRFDETTRTLLRGEGYASLLSAPVQRQASGSAVVVLFREETIFSDDDLALARHLSGAARGALERSELFEAERRARSLSERLATLGAGLVTNLAPGLVLEEVAREAPALLDVDAAAVRLLEGEDLVVRAVAGAGTSLAVGASASSGSGLLGDVVQSRRPVIVEDVRATPQLGRGDPLLPDSMGSCLAVPMTAHGGGLHGVLSVYAAQPRAWRPDEAQALVALAAMASSALSNAELYQSVADEKERSEAILGNIADGIVATDRDGRIVLWNSMAEQITGVPAGEALGRRVAEALQRELASEDSESAGERPVAIMRGGKEVWLSLTEAVMRDGAGTVAGRIFAFRDVSSERAVEQMKSDFVATVSHELRTPLTSIYGFAETLSRPDVAFDEAERAVFLGYITSESERLIRIVDDLLNVARLEAGTIGLALGPTDVGDVVAQAIRRLDDALDGRHRVVADLPDSGLVAEADPARLAQVVGHLVDNAVKFSPEGGTITVSGRRTSDAIEVRVVDEGMGISPADRQRIFTKFFRAESGPGASAAGTGIGLFLVRGLVAAMRGRIWVESQEGEGSSFVFELPVWNPDSTGKR